MEHMENDSKSQYLYCEEIVDMGLAGTHPAIACLIDNIIGSGQAKIDYNGIMEQLHSYYLKDNLSNIKLPNRILNHITKINKEFINNDQILLHIRFVYLYTIEEPPIYRSLNNVLSNKKFWHEVYPIYERPKKYYKIRQINDSFCSLFN